MLATVNFLERASEHGSKGTGKSRLGASKDLAETKLLPMKLNVSREVAPQAPQAPKAKVRSTLEDFGVGTWVASDERSFFHFLIEGLLDSIF